MAEKCHYGLDVTQLCILYDIFCNPLPRNAYDRIKDRPIQYEAEKQGTQLPWDFLVFLADAYFDHSSKQANNNSPHKIVDISTLQLPMNSDLKTCSYAQTLKSQSQLSSTPNTASQSSAQYFPKSSSIPFTLKKTLLRSTLALKTEHLMIYPANCKSSSSIILKPDFSILT